VTEPAVRPGLPAPDGLVVVDKPAGWTSHDVVARTRRLAGTRKVGHAGTLDPMATGVLVLGIGRATRLLTYVVGADKSYEATIRLGASTVTDDAEGEVTDRCAPGALGDVTDDAVSRAVAAVTGAIQQVPSAVSAIKVDGKRSYARVRSGEQVQLAARPVTVHRFVVRGSRPALDDGHAALDHDVEVDVSSGTYVRALARDLGRRLGVGGHLTALRRTRVGPYGLDVAATLDQLADQFEVLPLAQAASAIFPVRSLSEAQAATVRHGQRLPASGLGEGPVAAIGPGGDLVGLLEDRGAEARSLLVVPQP
jgi:tRNA pseudouridine55 synthase